MKQESPSPSGRGECQEGVMTAKAWGITLNLVPEKLHQRSPAFLGSKKDVELIESFLN